MEGVAKWVNFLVGQFMDKSLPFHLVNNFMNHQWSQFGKVEVMTIERGCFCLNCEDAQIRDEILEARLWFVANKSLILHK